VLVISIGSVYIRPFSDETCTFCAFPMVGSEWILYYPKFVYSRIRPGPFRCIPGRNPIARNPT
jgi:hypothetical protein